MEFNDFKDNPQDLVGKTVLYEDGHTYWSVTNKRFCKIEKVLAKGFKISCEPDLIFRLDDGYSKQHTVGFVSKCTLLTEEEVKELSLKWSRAKEERVLREQMKAKVETMTYEQLLEMQKI